MIFDSECFYRFDCSCKKLYNEESRMTQGILHCVIRYIILKQAYEEIEDVLYMMW